jgi:hypothetical protein
MLSLGVALGHLQGRRLRGTTYNKKKLTSDNKKAGLHPARRDQVRPSTLPRPSGGVFIYASRSEFP